MRYFVEYCTNEKGWDLSHGTMAGGPVLSPDGFQCKVGAIAEARSRQRDMDRRYPERGYRYRVVDSVGLVVAQIKEEQL